MQRYSDNSMVQQQETSCGVEAYLLDVCKQLALENFSYLKASWSATSFMHGSKGLSVAAVLISLGFLFTSAISGMETDMQGKDMANDPKLSERSTRCDIMMRSVCSHHALI